MAIRELTRLGTSPRKIARLLQAKAPEGHILAYITPEEADVLKARGGSGKPEPETGIPSFEEVDDMYQYVEPAAPRGPSWSSDPVATVYAEPREGDYGFTGPIYQQPTQGDYGFVGPTMTAQDEAFRAQMDAEAARQASTRQMNDYFSRYGGQQFATASAAPFAGAGAPVTPTGFEGFPTEYFQTPQLGMAAPGAAAPVAAEAARLGVPVEDLSRRLEIGGEVPVQDLSRRLEVPGQTIGDRFRDLAKGLGISPDLLGRFGVAGIQSLLGAQQARQAAAQGRQAKAEMRQISSPYQIQGQQLQAQAQRGELTPAGQQALQALQARAAQQAATQGGVGVAQAQAQIEAFRQQLLQQQADYGLKLSNIGDQIALGAIREGVQADRYVNDLTNAYYNNVARMIGGQGPLLPGQQQPQQQQPFQG